MIRNPKSQTGPSKIEYAICRYWLGKMRKEILSLGKVMNMNDRIGLPSISMRDGGPQRVGAQPAKWYWKSCCIIEVR